MDVSKYKLTWLLTENFQYYFVVPESKIFFPPLQTPWHIFRTAFFAPWYNNLLFFTEKKCNRKCFKQHLHLIRCLFICTSNITFPKTLLWILIKFSTEKHFVIVSVKSFLQWLSRPKFPGCITFCDVIMHQNGGGWAKKAVLKILHGSCPFQFPYIRGKLVD